MLRALTNIVGPAITAHGPHTGLKQVLAKLLTSLHIEARSWQPRSACPQNQHQKIIQALCHARDVTPPHTCMLHAPLNSRLRSKRQEPHHSPMS
jgi:hypothetical protein